MDQVFVDEHRGPVGQLAAVGVLGLLGHEHQDLGVGDPGIMDGAPGNDHVGAAGSAPGFRAVALGKDRVQMFEEGGGFAQDMAGQDDTLPAETGQTDFCF